jgi:NAD(P)-dependent dehydrogenase (short-subunit alcohol dehydrogenase family)
MLPPSNIRAVTVNPGMLDTRWAYSAAARLGIFRLAAFRLEQRQDQQFVMMVLGTW